MHRCQAKPHYAVCSQILLRHMECFLIEWPNCQGEVVGANYPSFPFPMTASSKVIIQLLIVSNH